MDERIRNLELAAKKQPEYQAALEAAKARTEEGAPKMVWDQPKLELKDLTKEQLIAHCEREAAYDRVHGNKTAQELKEKLQQLEYSNYQYGYILDKVWLSLCRETGLDNKTYPEKEPRKIVNAILGIIGDLKNTQATIERASKHWCPETQSSSNKLVRRCMRPPHPEEPDKHFWSNFRKPPESPEIET